MPTAKFQQLLSSSLRDSLGDSSKLLIGYGYFYLKVVVVLKPVSGVDLGWKIQCSCQFEENTVKSSLQEILLLCNPFFFKIVLVQKCGKIRRKEKRQPDFVTWSCMCAYICSSEKCLQVLLDLRPFQSSLIQKLYTGSGKGWYQHLSVFFLLFIRLYGLCRLSALPF